jgi:hypothetical protein
MVECPLPESRQKSNHWPYLEATMAAVGARFGGARPMGWSERGPKARRDARG